MVIMSLPSHLLAPIHHDNRNSYFTPILRSWNHPNTYVARADFTCNLSFFLPIFLVKDVMGGCCIEINRGSKVAVKRLPIDL